MKFSPTWCAVPSALPRDRGGITAEWALVLPAVILVFAAVLSAVGVMVQQSRLDAVAADAARLASIGYSSPSITEHVVDQLGEAAAVSLQSRASGVSVCAVVSSAPSGLATLVEGLRAQGMACALRESEPLEDPVVSGDSP
ncbi:TadE/TadG family type IV pilus assembly protein [Pontimonas sp.]|uniref:TadE/TadG family type IV pilus assembly protein n=1 Tax=Pontimonas sp. TaxID=2304492 RepID=UPI0028708319|nr:TadE/TadG family type IV pilus assembly protein [Pontimonas sp.]MDR9396076.1 TadE/TadG family type IV pilus assembly protein [Pontimonas sp.]